MAVAVWAWQAPPGSLTIEETSERKDAVSNALHKPAADSEQRQYVIARLLQPDSKYMVLYDSMYKYVLVYTSMHRDEYVRVCNSMYQHNQRLQIFIMMHIFFFHFWLQNTMCCD